jgi:hypothetical protein
MAGTATAAPAPAATPAEEAPNVTPGNNPRYAPALRRRSSADAGHFAHLPWLAQNG